MAAASALFDAWLRRRHPPAAGSLRLARRRLYILPASFGLMFGLLLLILFLWSVNYSNSLGFVLTFWLAGVALVAMWRCHNTLLDLCLTPLGVAPVFAGEALRFPLLLEAPDAAPRRDVTLWFPDGEPVVTDVEPPGSRVELVAPTTRRGWWRPGRLRIETRYPLGLFRAWSWCVLDRPCLVYPAPRGDRPLPAPQPQGDETISGDENAGDDFSGLRAYRPGDAPRHIAWKASSRGDSLLVKQFSAAGMTELWLDWAALAPLDEETRLSQLCAWVLEAEMHGQRYGLRLPGRLIGPDRGGAHRAACLKALALHGLVETPPAA